MFIKQHGIEPEGGGNTHTHTRGREEGRAPRIDACLLLHAAHSLFPPTEKAAVEGENGESGALVSPTTHHGNAIHDIERGSLIPEARHTAAGKEMIG